MARVRAIHLSPIKSLGLMSAERVTVTEHGIPGDRGFVLVDEHDEVATLRSYGSLARARSAWDPAGERLTVTLADGSEVSGTVTSGEPRTVRMFGQDLACTAVEGPWSEALSELSGAPLRLLRVCDHGSGQDTHPMSLLSVASLQELSRRSGSDELLDPRRYRNTLLIEDSAPHEEDAWVGRRVRAGQAVLDVVTRDPRCALITRNPDTGERDLDTLRMIAEYRPPVDRAICFGVYADVVQPGTVAVGDTVEPL